MPTPVCPSSYPDQRRGPERSAAELARHPALAKELLADMAEDPDRFLRRVTLVSGEPSEFYNTPVLTAIEPDKFIKLLLDLHPARQRTVLLALKARYQHGNLDRELSTERPWADEVRHKLLAASGAMSPITRYRIHQSLKYPLDGVLGVDDNDLEAIGATENTDRAEKGRVRSEPE